MARIERDSSSKHLGSEERGQQQVRTLVVAKSTSHFQWRRLTKE